MLSNRFFNSSRYFHSKLFNGLNRFRKSRSGAILIEFAFSVPVFLALIYYAHDPCKVKRYRRKMQFVANQLVQIIQSISQSRTDPRITQNDIAHAVRMAYLTVFPGISMVPTKDSYLPLGYYIEFYMYYIVGVSRGNASVKWQLQLYWTANSVAIDTRKSSNDWGSMIKFKTNVPPQQIYKGLASIKEGEAKIIVECHLRYGTNMHFSDGRTTNVSPKELFGFLLYSPRADSANGDWKSFFISVAIFTPRKGLFSDNPP